MGIGTSVASPCPDGMETVHVLSPRCSSTTSLVQAHKPSRQPGPHPADAAATAAAVLRDYPDSAGHFGHLAEDRTCDPRICQAVRQV